MEIVQCLVEQGADKEKANHKGNTPLITACVHRHLEVVGYLLDQGAKEKANHAGYTSLHFAADQGCVELVYLLLHHGADRNARTNDGHLPIDLARSKKIKQALNTF